MQVVHPVDRVILPGGASVRAGSHGSIFVDVPVGPDPERPDEFRPVRAVRQFFSQRRDRPDGSRDVPLLNFEVIQTTSTRATIRVFGPVECLARYFDSPALWPKWCLSVALGIRGRVAGQSALPSERFGVTDSGTVAVATVRQSETRRDVFARLPQGGAGRRPNVRRAVSYARLSADNRRRAAPLTAPRPVVPTVDVPA